jgi:hypothetical protein
MGLGPGLARLLIEQTNTSINIHLLAPGAEVIHLSEFLG